jgi:hypothetical protein
VPTVVQRQAQADPSPIISPPLVIQTSRRKQSSNATAVPRQPARSQQIVMAPQEMRLEVAQRTIMSQQAEIRLQLQLNPNPRLIRKRPPAAPRVHLQDLRPDHPPRDHRRGLILVPRLQLLHPRRQSRSHSIGLPQKHTLALLHQHVHRMQPRPPARNLPGVHS